MRLMASFGTAWHAIRDPLHRSRIRWFMLGWIITVPTVLLGGGFAIGGTHLVLAKGAFVIYARIPGGLHTHGVILTLLGLALVAGLSAPMFGQPEPRYWLRKVLKFTGYYYGWSAGMLLLAPLVKGGDFSYVGVIIWGAFACLPAVLLVGPPPALVPKSETDLIRAALEVGITPAQATALVNSLSYTGAPNARG